MISPKKKFRDHFADLIAEAKAGKNGDHVITVSELKGGPIEKYIDDFNFTKVKFDYFFPEKTNELWIRVFLKYSKYSFLAFFEGRLHNCEFEYEGKSLYCLCGNYSDDVSRIEINLDDKEIFDGIMLKFDELISWDYSFEELKEYIITGKPDEEANLWTLLYDYRNSKIWTRNLTVDIDEVDILTQITY